MMEWLFERIGNEIANPTSVSRSAFRRPPVYGRKVTDGLLGATLILYSKVRYTKIKKVTLRREPLSDTLTLALEGVSGVTWAELTRKHGYETFFHLSGIFELEDGRLILLEKNDTVTISQIETIESKQPGTQYLPLDAGAGDTLERILNETLEELGGEQFFRYSALGQKNCQDFMKNVCESMYSQMGRQNYYLPPDVALFVYQPVEEIAQELPTGTRIFAQAATDVAAAGRAVVSRLSGGGTKSLYGGATDEQFMRATQASYKTNERKIEGLEFIERTPTVTAYLDKESGRLLFSVRGTKSLEDVGNWIPSQVGGLKWGDRYARDKKFVEDILARYPDKEADITGHSLGGAIATQIKKDMPDKIREAQVYNAAMNVMDREEGRSEGVKRIYANDDYILRAYNFLGVELPEGTTVVDSNSGHRIDPLATHLHGHNDEFPLMGGGKSALLPGGSTRRWRKIRARVLKRDVHRCHYCGKRANEVDHKRPRSKGGSDDLANLTAACEECNSKKSNKRMRLS